MSETTIRKKAFYQAMTEAVAQEMERDDDVFVIGEDVGAMGGVFQSTLGLHARFGSERVMDTPISETGIMGVALGAAAEGLRPIAELMFVDFMAVCFDQIMNEIAKTHYMSGGAVKLPLVITASTGGGFSDAGQHSQTLHGLFAHVPGLKVVAPSNPHDAKGLMTTAIRDNNPVVYMFHKALMGLPIMGFVDAEIDSNVPEESYAIPFGEARIVREGSDVTIVGFSQTVAKAVVAARQLEEQGIDAEIIDPRTLVPFDTDALVKSVSKTGRLLVVDEDYLNYGMTGEITALVAERLDSITLKSPVRRLGIPGVSIPYSRPLEYAAIPQPDHIVDAVTDMMNLTVA
ncbi:alpha-ketoacid dehydrogenase subunit beta [Pseudohalioglobus lutimaris]|uniref:2-oxoisovalerate dehydrogenase subunit beta n=1 Tax=Pseudohalioglobus lutimaris TaxID=1737061 RepID=A0A2N5X5T7_9GAMM|nr:alpha-ketoacid dehydrogenase subunit beta [Pseudohalioglobus lutimaris]PLW69855.1 alpha-ketoacid dehydrogenase subunit beta [Pseudohalioglobus lutimaris]